MGNDVQKCYWCAQDVAAGTGHGEWGRTAGGERVPLVYHRPCWTAFVGRVRRLRALLTAGVMARPRRQVTRQRGAA